MSEQFYRVKIEVIVKAENEGEVNRQIFDKIMWIDDILEIEQENFEHLSAKEIVLQHLLRIEKE